MFRSWIFKENPFGLKTLGDGARFCVNLPGGPRICGVTGKRIRRGLRIRNGSFKSSPLVLLFPLSLPNLQVLW